MKFDKNGVLFTNSNDFDTFLIVIYIKSLFISLGMRCKPIHHIIYLCLSYIGRLLVIHLVFIKPQTAVCISSSHSVSSWQGLSRWLQLQLPSSVVFSYCKIFFGYLFIIIYQWGKDTKKTLHYLIIYRKYLEI